MPSFPQESFRLPRLQPLFGSIQISAPSFRFPPHFPKLDLAAPLPLTADASMLELLRHRKNVTEILDSSFHPGMLSYFHTNPNEPSSPRSAVSVVVSKDSDEKMRKKSLQAPKDPDFGLKSYKDDNSWCSVCVSIVKIVVCFVAMMATTFLWIIILFLLLPWPYQRIKQGNVYGHVTGRMLMWILGNPIKLSGMEFASTQAIYICNHASPLDIFLVMWLIPTGTVGIAKKEIIWYPLFGQLYILANHLRIDRSNSISSVRSLREIARVVVDKKLSIVIFPEGTRSATGRLLPFRKGFVHLALQTKLPILPMVLTATHLAWQKNSLHVRPAPLTVTFLPPIKTDGWAVDKADEYVNMVHALYVSHLPQSQKPLSEKRE